MYGNQYLPIDENHSINPINPYGKNKTNIESLLYDVCYRSKVGICCLRYFNPMSSESGLIGELQLLKCQKFTAND